MEKNAVIWGGVHFWLVKNTQQEIYHFKQFKVYNSGSLSKFTALSNNTTPSSSLSLGRMETLYPLVYSPIPSSSIPTSTFHLTFTRNLLCPSNGNFKTNHNSFSVPMTLSQIAILDIFIPHYNATGIFKVLYDRSWQIFYVKSRVVNILGAMAHMAAVSTIQLGPTSMKVAVDST